MSTNIRPELSQKNDYYIDRHRYYELKHFCMQYPEWKKNYSSLNGWHQKDILSPVKSTGFGDPVGNCVEAREFYLNRMTMVEKAAKEADPELGQYVLIGVTNGFSYGVLKARLDIPCCKDVYYDIYRRFFWLLSQARK